MQQLQNTQFQLLQNKSNHQPSTTVINSWYIIKLIFTKQYAVTYDFTAILVSLKTMALGTKSCGWFRWNFGNLFLERRGFLLAFLPNSNLFSHFPRLSS